MKIRVIHDAAGFRVIRETLRSGKRVQKVLYAAPTLEDLILKMVSRK